MLAKSRYVPQSRVVSVINGPPRNYMLRNRAVNFMQVKSVALFLKASMPMRAHNIDLPEIYWYFCIVATKWFFFTHHMVSFLGNVWSHVLFFDQLKQANTGQILFFLLCKQLTENWKKSKKWKKNISLKVYLLMKKFDCQPSLRWDIDQNFHFECCKNA